MSESGYPPALPQEISNQIPEEDPHPEFAHIRLLMGAESYYLYDDSAMTDAYARWAFLAAEDDPVATFIECVREESSVYPRPMARESLANDPFRMKAEAVEAAFAEARAQGRADDIERVEASNGDVYFYSTTYLTPRRAQALAEWDAVERIRNVSDPLNSSTRRATFLWVGLRCFRRLFPKEQEIPVQGIGLVVREGEGARRGKNVVGALL